MSNTATARRPLDAYALNFDRTDDFFIDPEDRPYIESIRSIFAMDRNERTHLCELTPSYFLIHLYDEIYWTDAGDALDEYKKDELYQAYCYCGTEDEYQHCAGIDRMIEADAPGTVEHYGDLDPSAWADESEDPDENHAADMEKLREQLCGNCPF
jgi:hypothetical protein